MSDIESDEDIPELDTSPHGSLSQQGSAIPDDDRRAHHNALERKRRDHIKDSFTTLREVVPSLKGEKASRALILKKASDYIHKLNEDICNHHKDILEIKRQNLTLEECYNEMHKRDGQDSKKFAENASSTDHSNFTFDRARTSGHASSAATVDPNAYCHVSSPSCFVDVVESSEDMRGNFSVQPQPSMPRVLAGSQMTLRPTQQ